MDLKLLATVFITIFVAELGDKTQLSTMLYASAERHNKWVVFLGASLALVTTSALGVFAGALIGSHLNTKVLARLAGAGFILVGLWTLAKA